MNVPLAPGTAKSTRWRSRFQTVIFPRLIEFKPDFIFISAGFDAHEKDHLHTSGDTEISEFDYQWVTE